MEMKMERRTKKIWSGGHLETEVDVYAAKSSNKKDCSLKTSKSLFLDRSFLVKNWPKIWLFKEAPSWFDLFTWWSPSLFLHKFTRFHGTSRENYHRDAFFIPGAGYPKKQPFLWLRQWLAYFSKILVTRFCSPLWPPSGVGGARSTKKIKCSPGWFRFLQLCKNPVFRFFSAAIGGGRGRQEGWSMK